uniref:Uncharacterized protein n=1 Tax=Glossina pallidipes TaxID=7398 RepID=A0A1A9ZFC8_GLOPL
MYCKGVRCGKLKLIAKCRKLKLIAKVVFEMLSFKVKPREVSRATIRVKHLICIHMLDITFYISATRLDNFVFILVLALLLTFIIHVRLSIILIITDFRFENRSLHDVIISRFLSENINNK